jgi:Flp pilus assembly protein TadB
MGLLYSNGSELQRAQALLRGSVESATAHDVQNKSKYSLHQSRDQRSIQGSLGFGLASVIENIIDLEIFARLFSYAALSELQKRALILRAIGFSLSFSILAIIFTTPSLLLLIIAYLGLEYLWLKRKIVERARSFERDYTALLLSLASAVRTGLDPLVALSQAGELFSKSSVIRRELLIFKDNCDRGLTEELAIRGFASSIAHPDIALFRSAMILARKEGSSLSSCLERLARVTRQRQSFRRKVQAAVALQKISAIAIGACALVIISIQYSSNTSAFMAALSHPLASRVIWLGFGLVIIGIVWLSRMAKGGV